MDNLGESGSNTPDEQEDNLIGDLDDKKSDTISQEVKLQDDAISENESVSNSDVQPSSEVDEGTEESQQQSEEVDQVEQQHVSAHVSGHVSRQNSAHVSAHISRQNSAHVSAHISKQNSAHVSQHISAKVTPLKSVKSTLPEPERAPTPVQQSYSNKFRKYIGQELTPDQETSEQAKLEITENNESDEVDEGEEEEEVEFSNENAMDEENLDDHGKYFY